MATPRVPDESVAPCLLFASPPFAALPPGARRRLLVAAAAATLATGAGLAAVGAPLTTAAAPHGIVSFEFAGDLPRATRILESWDAPKRVRAGLSLGADFLFLALYPVALALACGEVARRLATPAPRTAALGAVLARGQPLAGLLDALENAALIALLLGSREPLWPTVALVCAAPKFALVAAGLAYPVLGGLAVLAHRRGRA